MYCSSNSLGWLLDWRQSVCQVWVVYSYVEFLNYFWNDDQVKYNKSIWKINFKHIRFCAVCSHSSITRESSELGLVDGGWGNTHLKAQMVKDDNENVTTFATREQTAMLETNQHAHPGSSAELGYHWGWANQFHKAFWLVLWRHNTSKAL